MFDQLATDWASDTIFVMELLDAARAECVSTVDEYARDTLTNIILECTELAYVQPTRLIIQIDQITPTLAIHVPPLYLL